LWLSTYKNEILTKGQVQEDHPFFGTVPSKSLNQVLIRLFFKSCTTTIDLIQSKIEFEKSNADNSAETKPNEKDDQLR
jgi:hypothetical protein